MKDFLKLIFFGVSGTPELVMVNPDGGEKKKMATGFSWSILLVGGFFGLPLFFKRLWGWAWLMFGLTTVQFVSFYLQLKRILAATTVEEYYALQQGDPVDTVAGALLLICAVYLAFKGNRAAVTRLLKKGWRFENPDDPVAAAAIKKWKISKHYLKPAEKANRL